MATRIKPKSRSSQRKVAGLPKYLAALAMAVPYTPTESRCAFMLTPKGARAMTRATLETDRQGARLARRIQRAADLLQTIVDEGYHYGYGLPDNKEPTPRQFQNMLLANIRRVGAMRKHLRDTATAASNLQELMYQLLDHVEVPEPRPARSRKKVTKPKKQTRTQEPAADMALLPRAPKPSRRKISQ